MALSDMMVRYLDHRATELEVEWEVAYEVSERADAERDSQETGNAARDTKTDGLFYRWDALNDERMRVADVLVRGTRAPSRQDQRGALAFEQRRARILR